MGFIMTSSNMYMMCFIIPFIFLDPQLPILYLLFQPKPLLLSSL